MSVTISLFVFLQKKLQIFIKTQVTIS